MNNSPQVDAVITIHDNCPITYLITQHTREVEFAFGPRHDLHYIFDGPALRHFLQVGSEALTEMEAAATAEEPATT